MSSNNIVQLITLHAHAILRHEPFDMKLVVRKGLAYTGITVFMAVSFLIVFRALNYLFQTSSIIAGMALTVGMAVVMTCTFNSLRVGLGKYADRLLYGKTYQHRQTVLSFASRMSNVIDLEPLAQAILMPVTNAVCSGQASLLFASNGHWRSRFAQRLVEGEPVIPIELPNEGPIVTWLAREGKPLSLETINLGAEFKGLCREERRVLDAAEIELLFPIISRQRLIAILTLSQKQPRGFYSRNDTDMIMTLARETAVAIENAQLYAQANERANTDELTGLSNHRHFYECLDEEIIRSSRFGTVFSLMFLDMDLFKKYNDVSGHLAGDRVLKRLGQHIQESVRKMDICFRYGGDEFAIILSETPLDSARKVAERVRREIESQMDWQEIPLTCSIGIASWPTDGVMREDVVQAADTALYYAKRTGRNRICVPYEVPLPEVLKMEARWNPISKGAVLDTIYALAATVDAKDHFTYGHSKKVSKYSTDIAEALGYSREGIERIRVAALLHDIGKIGVPDRLLKKRGPLTPEEWELVRAHPNLGVAILKRIDSLKGCLAAIQYHHERYDGTGYPAGLKGNNIPVDARILAVADAYDAMTSERAYRNKKLTYERALQELKRCAGTQLDPTIVEVFVELSRQPSPASVKTEPGLDVSYGTIRLLIATCEIYVWLGNSILVEGV